MCLTAGARLPCILLSISWLPKGSCVLHSPARPPSPTSESQDPRKPRLSIKDHFGLFLVSRHRGPVWSFNKSCQSVIFDSRNKEGSRRETANATEYKVDGQWRDWRARSNIPTPSSSRTSHKGTLASASRRTPPATNSCGGEDLLEVQYCFQTI